MVKSMMKCLVFIKPSSELYDGEKLFNQYSFSFENYYVIGTGNDVSNHVIIFKKKKKKKNAD